MIKLVNIPIFQITSLIFALAFLLSLICIIWQKKWKTLQQPVSIWITGVALICVNQVSYICALKKAPPEQVELIIYFWPILVAISSTLLLKHKFSVGHLLCCAISLAGISTLLINDSNGESINSLYFSGYFFALLASLSWALFTVFCCYHKNLPNEMTGMYFGPAAFFSYIFHIYFEVTIAPDTHEWIYLLFTGIGITGAAYRLWDFGIKNGNLRILTLLSYTNPIISIGLLIAFGAASPSSNLAIACFLVTAGSTCSLFLEKRNLIPLQLSNS